MGKCNRVRRTALGEVRIVPLWSQQLCLGVPAKVYHLETGMVLVLVGLPGCLAVSPGGALVSLVTASSGVHGSGEVNKARDT